jgi:APA family basic amino acid/polyamine antiporter
MAQDGVFFGALARIHPRFATPAASLVAQGIMALLLTFTGTYQQLYTYVIFAIFLFHAATGAALLVLRARRPEAQRPFRVPGYPGIPLLFIATSLAFVANTIWEKPRESLGGVIALLLCIPAYFAWRRCARVSERPTLGAEQAYRGGRTEEP